MGICVWFPNGTRFFFPGSTIVVARVMMDMNVPADLREHPDTRIEFGVKEGRRWTAERVIKPGRQV